MHLWHLLPTHGTVETVGTGIIRITILTPLKINMEPENTPLETIIFRFYVNLWGCSWSLGALRLRCQQEFLPGQQRYDQCFHIREKWGRSQGKYMIYHGPPKPTCLEVFMVNNLVFRWPKPLFFMVLGAHGISFPLVLRKSLENARFLRFLPLDPVVSRDENCCLEPGGHSVVDDSN